MEVPVYNKDVSICGSCSPIIRDGEQQVEECKACQNIMLYHAKKEKTDAEIKERNTSLEQEFPGPCKIKNNEIFGNYVVAARRIEEGELICEEQPLLYGPYGPSDLIPFCLSCYKDIGLSKSNKCSKCKWPVCNSGCENMSSHADNECKIFSENQIIHKGFVVDYFSIEVIRCLLSKERDPKKWMRITQLEPHTILRQYDSKAVDGLAYITEFIQDKCKLDYDDWSVNQAVGVLSVNTFWAHKDTQKYASLLFDKVSLIAHDCDPNTTRRIIVMDSDKNVNEAIKMKIQIHAARTIEKGENISIHYVDPIMKVKERREELKSIFYFDCCCGRCLTELLELTEIQDQNDE